MTLARFRFFFICTFCFVLGTALAAFLASRARAADAGCEANKDPNPLATCTIAPATKPDLRFCLGAQHPRCFELATKAGLKKSYTLTQILDGMRGSSRDITESEYKSLQNSVNEFERWLKTHQKKNATAKAPSCAGLIAIEGAGPSPNATIPKDLICRENAPQVEMQKRLQTVVDRLETTGATKSQ